MRRILRAKSDRQQDGFSNALRLFHEATQRVPAYKDFLKQQGITRPDLIKTKQDYSQVPPTDKPNYFSKYTLAELCWDGKLSRSRYISMSSGSTGGSFYWARGETQDEAVGCMQQQVLDKIFMVSSKRSLVINSFGLGSWIAGLEMHQALCWAQDNDSKITIVSPGIDKALAVQHVIKLGPLFDQIVIVGYPPFVKDILDACESEGFDLSEMEIRMWTAGESVSETWRRNMLNKIHRPDSLTHIINYYGLAESGTSAHETPTSIALRQVIVSGSNRALYNRFGGEKLSSIYQYNPAIRYFELGYDDVLLLTSPAGMPLIRYNTRDQGGIVSFQEALELAGDSMRNKHLTNWQLPFMYLFGRQDLSIRFYALNVYPENIKAALENPEIYSSVTGIFVMETKTRRNMDQFLEITIELAPSTVKSGKLKTKLTSEVVKALRKHNSEYDKLYRSIGEERATPELILKAHGTIGHVPGKKHKWAKRD